jgi:hypothetical protein
METGDSVDKAEPKTISRSVTAPLEPKEALKNVMMFG